MNRTNNNAVLRTSSCSDFMIQLRAQTVPSPQPITPLFAMATIAYTTPLSATNHLQVNHKHITIPLAQLNAQHCIETWSAHPISSHTTPSNLLFHQDAELACGYFECAVDATVDFSAICADAYHTILTAARQAGYPYLLRTWNYFPAINHTVKNHTRYEAFCAGRQQAWHAYHQDVHNLPAATVVGTQCQALQILFIATRAPGVCIENPRQTSAFAYPTAAQQARPLFARAVLKAFAQHMQFHISGTASIVGHTTQHIQNLAKQFDEALFNVHTLITHAHRHHGLPIQNVHQLSMVKVYVHPAYDHLALNNKIRATWNDTIPVLILSGEMCRPDLLVEIEGLYIGSH